MNIHLWALLAVLGPFAVALVIAYFIGDQP